MPSYISTSLAGLTEGNFTIRANDIITGMKDNPDFPTPPHLIPGVETMFLAFKVLSKERYLMSPKDYNDRRSLRDKLNISFRDNGQYVIALFPGDRDKQLSSRFEPVKEKNNTGEPNIPIRLKASPTKNSGEALLNWTGSSNARGYNIRYRIKTGEETAWQYKAVSKSRGVLIEGLQPGQLYEFWVQAIGAKKDSDFGGPAETRVM